MILEIIIIFLAVMAVAIIANHCENRIKKERDKISIRESMDLAEVPIITFQDGDIKLNFLLDSGSSHCHISANIAKMLVGTSIKADCTYTTATGSDSISEIIESVLRYKDKEFKVDLLVNESLEASFEEVKKECGIQLHGILGSNFLKEYKYILDFEELVVYHK